MKKPEFSEVLLPPSSASSQTQNTTYCHKGYSGNNKLWLAISTIFLAVCLSALTLGVILRYEEKFYQYEGRVIALELELESMIKKVQDIEASNIESLLQNYMDDIDLDLDEDENWKESIEAEGDIDTEGDDDSFGRIILEKNMPKDRRKRQIPLYTSSYGPEIERNEEGVPILNQSYSEREKNQRPFSGYDRRTQSSTPDSEGLRLYENLVVVDDDRRNPKSGDFYDNTGSSGILPHHRQSAAWSPQTRSIGGSGPSFSDEPNYNRGVNSGSAAILSTSSGASPNLHRNSRVAQSGVERSYPSPTTRQRNYGGYQHPPLQRLGEGDDSVIARVLQNEAENEAGVDNHAEAETNYGDSATSFSESRRYRITRRPSQNPNPNIHGNNPRRREQQRRRGSEEISLVKAEAWAEGPKMIAAHYVADTSNYTMRHRHYDGNGRLRNADGIFSSWKQADWMIGTEGAKSFSLSQTGVVTIRETGLYYIYAQIHYLDEHDINGFIVQINSDPFLQCTTMTETYRASSKSNSCYTGGLHYLKENDRVILKDIETNRYSIFRPEKSFFGLVRIGESFR